VSSRTSPAPKPETTHLLVRLVGNMFFFLIRASYISE
jgi:hypothetical protein